MIIVVVYIIADLCGWYCLSLSSLSLSSLLLWQRYLCWLVDVPIDVAMTVSDVVEQLRPKLVMCETWEDAVGRVEALEAVERGTCCAMVLLCAAQLYIMCGCMCACLLIPIY